MKKRDRHYCQYRHSIVCQCNFRCVTNDMLLIFLDFNLDWIHFAHSTMPDTYYLSRIQDTLQIAAGL